MIDLTHSILPSLRAHRLPNIEAGDHMIYPNYQGGSIANLPDSLCEALGVPALGSGALRGEASTAFRKPHRRVVLMVIDGFGLNMMQDAIASHDPALQVWQNLAVSGTLAPLTSISPSTTAAALTTFWTGQPPAVHGVLAYEMYLKEYGLIANMILHNPASFMGGVGSLSNAGFDPLTFLPVPTLGTHLKQHGVRATAFQHKSIAHSGLSSMLFKDVEVNSFRNVADLWATLGEYLRVPPTAPEYLYIYWGDLDELSHRYGPDDPRVKSELAAFSLTMGRMIEQLPKPAPGEETLFVVTADHGHILTPRREEAELRHYPDLMQHLVMLPTGEARLPIIYLRSGHEAAFFEAMEAHWPGQFIPIPSHVAIESGLFGGGSHHPRLDERAGDYVLVPQQDFYWWFSPARANPLLGRHGGLNQTEMLVPCFSFEV